jgi:hypothetical protein
MNQRLPCNPARGHFNDPVLCLTSHSDMSHSSGESLPRIRTRLEGECSKSQLETKYISYSSKWHSSFKIETCSQGQDEKKCVLQGG